MHQYLFLNANQTTRQDTQQLRILLEEFFGTAHDPEQMPISNETGDWIRTAIPECSLVIKCNDEVVGSTLIVPCTLPIMNGFINGNINEAELARKVQQQKITYMQMEAIYLCSFFIAPAYRHKGLALLTIKAVAESILNITPKNKKIPLFCWAYSEAGRKACKKLADILDTDLLERNPSSPLNIAILQTA